MQKTIISDDMAEVVSEIRKTKRLWKKILFSAIISFVLILGILLYTKNLATAWGLLLSLPLGPILIAWLLFNDVSEGLRSFESKYLFKDDMD